MQNKKLRCGVREEHHGESYTHWYVLDVEPGTLSEIRDESEQEYFPDDYVEEVLDGMVGDQFDRPYNTIGSYDTGRPDVSPSGRWFGNVSAWQVGRRLLVKQYHALDI